LVEWFEGELHHMRATQKPQTIDDALSADILGRLTREPTPHDIAMIIGRVFGGHFLAVRFGISSGFLETIASKDKFDMQAVWDEAWDIYTRTESRNISAMILATAIICQSQGGEKLISHLQLDRNDLLQGIKWYDRLRKNLDEYKAPQKNGGFARDWAFGYVPALERVGASIGRNWRQVSLTHRLVSHDDALRQLLDVFVRDGKKSSILVGADGVGKTQVVHAFAQTLMEPDSQISYKIKYTQVYLLDATTIIATAPGRGEVEKLLQMVIDEAIRAKNVIICFDNAHLFFEESIGSVDMSNLLLNIIDTTSIKLLLTMSDQKYIQITKRNPRISVLLNRITVEPATHPETFLILQDKSADLEYQNKVVFMYQALREAVVLGERYVRETAMPGKAISLLESAVQHHVDNIVSAESVRQSIEKTYGIKLGAARHEEERKQLIDMEKLIHRRMVNQKRAVSVVSDALRRARSGIRNQDRPVGTFLFLGPSGVGKTELAKSLSEVYYGGESNVIRVDMNEYSSESDSQRLIDDNPTNPHSLVSKITKQPFSVVLLDEIEKAHDSVLSVLLQAFDEGILRDSSNRGVSLRDAIIICTSNAGADRVIEYIDRGYDVDKIEKDFVDYLIESKQFRTEFLNRFDEVVVFQTLKKEELLKVVDLMIAKVNCNLESQHITVSVDRDAKVYLVDHGYDPKMGARPMRRIIERVVENTLAKKILSGEVSPGDSVVIEFDSIKEVISSQNQADKLT
jgi:ATP-dependent Clp protease ATP-binding subunit ClpC